MDDTKEKIVSVPYFIHEGIMTHHERTVKRLIIALIFAVWLMFVSNGLWLWAWMQYDYTSETTETVTVDGKDGVANYIGNDGVIDNGVG